jgi:acyl-CoA thioester hydrolase
MDIKPYQPEIRFSDIDALGHVNNAIYLTYFEQTRIYYFGSLISEKWDWNKFGLLVARNEIEYKAPILLNDKVSIHLGCKHIGTKSFSLDYRVEVERGSQKFVACVGASVMVSFDHQQNVTTAIPEIWREKFGALKSVTAAQS